MRLDLFMPWVCHLLVIVLFAYVLTPILQRRTLVVVLCGGVGCAAIAILSALDLYPGGWMEAQSYWAQLTAIFRRRRPRVDGWQWFLTLLFCWLIPVGVAWITTTWRRRKPIHPPDDAGEPPPRTFA